MSQPVRVNRTAVTACVMLATILQSVDTTIANVALPYMQGSLSASRDQIAWVLTSYIVAAAIMLPPTGWLAGRFGRRNLFLTAIGGFTIASALCGMAGTLGQLVAFRLMQGMFGASLIPLSQAVLLDTYPPEQHGQAMAAWGLGTIIGPILGPTLGGFLTEHYTWRAVFYVNMPLGSLAFIGMFLFLPDGARKVNHRLDWIGFGTLSLAVGAFQLMLDRGEQLDWFNSTEIITEAIVSGVAFYCFLVHTFTCDKPFVPPRLFRDRNFTVAVMFHSTNAMVMQATLSLIAPFLQDVVGYPAQEAGFLMGPRGFGTMCSMLFIGRALNVVDLRFKLLIGIGLNASALTLMSQFNADTPPLAVMTAGVMQGAGMGLIFIPLSALAFATLPAHLRTEGTSIYALIRNMAGSIGISVMASRLVANTQVNHETISTAVTAYDRHFRTGGAMQFWNPLTAAGQVSLDAEITRQATLIAYIDDFKVMVLICLCGAPLVLLLRPPRRKARASAAEAIAEAD
jgi:DHA2 family multidrug resistance protein